MCKIPLLISFAAVYVHIQCWEIVVTRGNQLEFYKNETNTNSTEFQFQDLKALTYDAVQNSLFFVDSHGDSASIFTYHLTTKKYELLLNRTDPFENIQSLAFDPVSDILFWTDYNQRSIFSISMKSKFKTVNRIMKLDDQLPKAIAVDSCRGFIYWTNINITSEPTIERANFSGYEREVVIGTDIYMPMSIVVDQQTKKIYWINLEEGGKYSVESSDLDGKYRKTLFEDTSNSHRPNCLTVSKDFIFWDMDKSVWWIPKQSQEDKNHKQIAVFPEFNDGSPNGIAANYQIQDQVQGINDCEILLKLKDKPDTPDKTSNPKYFGLLTLILSYKFCIHGEKVNEKCICDIGYTGKTCDISVCENYCIHGHCNLNLDGSPTCRCQVGYSGKICDSIDVCQHYCLNNGACSPNANNEPTCQCSDNHEGKRCEKFKAVTTEVSKITTEIDNKHTQKIPKYRRQTEDQAKTGHSAYDAVRITTSIVATLVILCIVCHTLVNLIRSRWI